MGRQYQLKSCLMLVIRLSSKKVGLLMMNQTKAIVEFERNEPYKNSQWTTDDFSPISAAIDAIFEKLGWLK